MPTALPPTFDRLERHAALPVVDHDDTARFNFLAGLNVSIGATLSPGVREAYEHQVRPAFAKQRGRDPANGREIRDAMRGNAFYQSWAALRRSAQEMSQAAARGTAVKSLAAVNATVARLNAGKNTLALDPTMSVPAPLAGIDNHLLPGSYHTELVPDDVTQAATYEMSLFPVAMGSLGAKGDAGGRAAARWVRARFPKFAPKRILDLGAGMGGNTLPLAEAFPEAEVVAYDAAAPLLRYGHARAQAMGYSGVHFVQGLIEDLDPTKHGSFDWVHTTMVWHETSTSTVSTGLARIHSVLNPGGLTTHVEQPNFTADTPLFDRFLRNWDAWYNNEPFWTKLHRMDMLSELRAAGFAAGNIFDGGTEADIEPGKYQSWSRLTERHKHEVAGADAARDYNGERWYVFGAWK